MDLPIACSLTGEQLRGRRQTLLSVRRFAIEVKELPDGYVYAFETRAMTLDLLARIVDLERQCCEFLTFKITVEPKQPIRLEVTGPSEAKLIIADFFGS